MKKKLLLLIMVLICTSVLVTGCGGPGKSLQTNASVPVSGVNEFPITEEEITLEIFMGKPNTIEDLFTNEFTKWYEEKTNVKIEWSFVNGDTRQAINLRLASNDYPDIFRGFSFARSEQVAYYAQDVFIDMTDLVDKHGHYIKEMFQKDPQIEKNVRHTDNKILGLPDAAFDFTGCYYNVMWVYKPWLDKLNLKVPETTEEFYHMLKAFKERDPNGNGIPDEIPLAARNSRGGTIGLDNFLMNAFNFSNDYGVYNKEGIATFAPIEDDFKEGLKYIRRLYQEGLIHPESFIMDRARISALAENDVPILGAAPGKWTTQFTTAGAPSGRSNEFVAIPPLLGPGGVRQTISTGNERDTGLSAFNITSQCENPEVAIKWVDWFYSQDAYLKAVAADGFRPAKEGELGLDGEQALFAVDPVESTAAFGALQNRNWGEFSISYRTVEDSIKTAYYTNDKIRLENAYQAYQMYKPYAKNIAIGDFPMSPEVSAEYLELRSNIKSAIDSGMVAFIIGEKSIEDDWDAYVQNFYNIGLERYVEIYQNYLDGQSK